MPPRAVAAFTFAVGLAGLAGCGGGQAAGPTLFFDSAWRAPVQDKGAVWFFPAVDEAAGWDEGRNDRVRCPAIVPQYWCAPVEVLSTAPRHRTVYGTGWSGPFGVAITARVPQQSFALRVRNESRASLGIGVDCPPEGRAFPVDGQSFTVVEIDSRAFRFELGQWRYCPSTSILGVVSHAPSRESALRALELAGARGGHPPMRIAALEALARLPDSGHCVEVNELVRLLQDGEASRRVRDYAKGRWPRDQLDRARASGGLCWP